MNDYTDFLLYCSDADRKRVRNAIRVLVSVGVDVSVARDLIIDSAMKRAIARQQAAHEFRAERRRQADAFVR